MMMVSPVKPVWMVVFFNCFCMAARFCNWAGVLQIYNCVSLGKELNAVKFAAVTPVPDKDSCFNSFNWRSIWISLVDLSRRARQLRGSDFGDKIRDSRWTP